MNRGRVYLDNTPKAPFELFQGGVNDNSVNFNSSIKRGTVRHSDGLKK